MLSHFIELFQYDTWANHRSLDSIGQLAGRDEKPRLAIAHIATAKLNWLDRIHGRDLRNAFFPDLTLSECRAKIDEAHAEWEAFLGDLGDEDLDRQITYRNLKGVQATRPLKHILTQLALHGPHHRGQIAGHVRAAGLEPASTDYILYAK